MSGILQRLIILALPTSLTPRLGMGWHGLAWASNHPGQNLKLVRIRPALAHAGVTYLGIVSISDSDRYGARYATSIRSNYYVTLVCLLCLLCMYSTLVYRNSCRRGKQALVH